METEFELLKYSFTVVPVFGIIGNILVIISILKQRCLLRNNYYVLVLQLAICDLAVLIIFLWDTIVRFWENKLFHPVAFCVHNNLLYVFKAAGVGMMLLISVLRYRATVHPLRPVISRGKLKVVYGLVYIVGFIVGCGTELPFCFVWLNSLYELPFLAIVYYLFPAIFMAVAYYKIGRALFKQSRHMKHLCHADAVRKRHINDRRTYVICLTTVVCYGIGNLPISAYYIVVFAAQYHSIQVSFWFFIVSIVLHGTCSYAANPVIYGILDKQLLPFWKCRKPNARRPQEQEQEQYVQQVGETPL